MIASSNMAPRNGSAPAADNLTPALYSTCPPFRGGEPEAYSAEVRDVARWSEEGGCDGILVYTDNGLLDPWLLAQLIIQSTTQLTPLVAVQPVYMHPYTVAKMVSTLTLLHRRRIDLNIVAGGFKNDLLALDDHTPHESRYARLTEYTAIIRALLEGGSVTFKGEFYSVTNLALVPALDPALMPRILLSGSSAAGTAAARTLGALPVRYPEPAAAEGTHPDEAVSEFGIRVGIIARQGELNAWSIARERFPEDRRGQVTHQLAMKVSDSAWHRQLSAIAPDIAPESVYWMVPFKNYKTFCPYLVGSYSRVGQEIGRYLAAGCRTIILDVPATGDEMRHIRAALQAAEKPVGAR